MANDGHEEGSAPANSCGCYSAISMFELRHRAPRKLRRAALAHAELPRSRTPHCAAMPADAYIRLDDRVPSVVNPFVSTPFTYTPLAYTKMAIVGVTLFPLRLAVLIGATAVGAVTTSVLTLGADLTKPLPPLRRLLISGTTRLTARAGLVVGPWDYVHRLGSWLERIHRGGRVVVPAEGLAQPIALVDARDLAGWLVGMAEAGTGGAATS